MPQRPAYKPRWGFFIDAVHGASLVLPLDR